MILRKIVFSQKFFLLQNFQLSCSNDWVEITQCENLGIFLPFRFYVKTIYADSKDSNNDESQRFEIQQEMISHKISVAEKLVEFHTVK